MGSANHPWTCSPGFSKKQAEQAMENEVGGSGLPRSLLQPSPWNPSIADGSRYIKSTAFAHNCFSSVFRHRSKKQIKQRACVYVCTLHECQCSRRLGEGVRAPGTGITGGVIHLTWVRGTEQRSFERAGNEPLLQPHLEIA